MEQTITPTGIASTQLSKFILGSWSSIDVKSSDFPSSADNQYQIVFEKSDQIKYIIVYPDGNKEGYTFSYYFVGQDSIQVENLRISGGEIWVLERSGESLIITRKIEGGAIRIVLERNN
jgi:hypothetical protein